jgi:hypothetical protein
MAAASPVTTFASWVNDDSVDKVASVFQRSGDGELDIRFFDAEGLPMNFYKSQDGYIVSSADAKDEYASEGLADAGDTISVSAGIAHITYVRESLGRFEVVAKPAAGFELNRFVDSSCACYADIKLVDGAYRVTPNSVKTLEAIFVKCIGADATVRTPVAMTLNGAKARSGDSSFIKNGRTMVSEQFIKDNFGANVDWNSKSNAVTIIAKGGSVWLKIGDSELTAFNGDVGEIIPMDTPAVIEDGHPFFPIRFVAEALGITVGWDENTRTASFVV